MPPPESSPDYNTSWILSPDSNISVATARSWFDSYTAFPSEVLPYGLPPREFPVLGIGSVSLPLKSYANKPGSATLVLDDVLHVPDAYTNIVCAGLLMDTHQLDMPLNRPDGAWVRDKTTGRKLGICELLGKKGEVAKLRLKGQKPGEASFSKDTTLEKLGVVWPAWEVERCKEELSRPAKRVMPVTMPEGRKFVELVDDAARDKQEKELEEADGTAPLTEKEEKWLQKHHGGMKGLLLKYGVTHPDEELLFHFRRAVRAMIAVADDGDE